MSADLIENVSRETMADLRAFEVLVRKWTKKINLVSHRDSAQIWERHIVDSVQVYRLAPPDGDWLDIGSGGGFPGIAAAILGKHECSNRKFTLVDSDQRKCAFLRTAVRELSLNAQVYAERIETMRPLLAQVLSARALDDLTGLLEYAELHMSKNGTALFPKGANWEKEHVDAQNQWSYNLEVINSRTNPDATILKIKELTRV